MQKKYFGMLQATFTLVLAFCSTNLAAAIFTVTRTTDTYPTGQPGELRWAIQQNNRTHEANTINFNIPGTGPFTIQPSHDLDRITNPVIINGYSQPHATPNTLVTGNNANLLIVLSGNNYQEGNAYQGTGNGLVFSTGSQGSIVKGLVINGWINTGVYIYSVNNISLLGNYIGTNAQGTTQLANQAGIFIQLANNTVIGTINPADRNIMAGSFLYFNESSCIGMVQANNTSIKNNYIGTDKTGMTALGNSLVGIECIACNGVMIGGSTTTARNIISGHTIMSISLIAVTNSFIQNNYIGTNAIGTGKLSNGNMGISLLGDGSANSTSGNTISKNVISAHNIGIMVGYASSPGTNQNTIQSNFIGTNASGSAALSNAYGIVINDKANIIGGTTAPARNIISGNTVGGILLYGPATNNIIQGNYVGVNAANTSKLLNGYGIQLGTAAGLVNGSNVIKNNTFGGSNTTTTICPSH